jgi:hypothetical protein
VLRRELVEGWERGRFDIACLRVFEYVSEGGCARGSSIGRRLFVCCCWSKGGEGSASRETRTGTSAAKSKRVLAGVVSRTFSVSSQLRLEHCERLIIDTLDSTEKHGYNASCKKVDYDG